MLQPWQIVMATSGPYEKVPSVRELERRDWPVGVRLRIEWSRLRT